MPKVITSAYFSEPYLVGALIECDCGYTFDAKDFACHDENEYVECPECGIKIIGKYKIWVENKKK